MRNRVICREQDCKVYERLSDQERACVVFPRLQPHVEWIEPVGWVGWSTDLRFSVKDQKREPCHMDPRAWDECGDSCPWMLEHLMAGPSEADKTVNDIDSLDEDGIREKGLYE